MSGIHRVALKYLTKEDMAKALVAAAVVRYMAPNQYKTKKTQEQDSSNVTGDFLRQPRSVDDRTS